MFVAEPAREPGCVSYSPIHIMPLQLVESGTLPLQSFRMAALEASSIMLASDQPAPRAWHAARAAGQVDSAVCPAYTGAVEIGEAEGEGEGEGEGKGICVILCEGEAVTSAVALIEGERERLPLSETVAVSVTAAVTVVEPLPLGEDDGDGDSEAVEGACDGDKTPQSCAMAAATCACVSASA